MFVENKLLHELEARDRLLAGETINLTLFQAACIQANLSAKLIAEHPVSQAHNASLAKLTLIDSNNSQVWHFTMDIETTYLNFNLIISVRNDSDRLHLESVSAKKGIFPIHVEKYLPKDLHDPTSMWEKEERLEPGSLLISKSNQKVELIIKEEYL